MNDAERFAHALRASLTSAWPTLSSRFWVGCNMLKSLPVT